MNWDKVSSSVYSKRLHNNIKYEKSQEILADAMDDDASEMPSDMDSPPGEEQGNFEELEGDSGGFGSDGGDSGFGGSDGGDAGGGGESGGGDFGGSDGGTEEEEEKPSGIRNNPLDDYNGKSFLIEEYNKLQSKVQKIIEKLNNSDLISSKYVDEFEELLSMIEKDKATIPLNPVVDSYAQFLISSKLVKIALKKIVSIVEEKTNGKSKENDNKK